MGEGDHRMTEEPKQKKARTIGVPIPRGTFEAEYARCRGQWPDFVVKLSAETALKIPPVISVASMFGALDDTSDVSSGMTAAAVSGQVSWIVIPKGEAGGVGRRDNITTGIMDRVEYRKWTREWIEVHKDRFKGDAERKPDPAQIAKAKAAADLEALLDTASSMSTGNERRRGNDDGIDDNGGGRGFGSGSVASSQIDDHRLGRVKGPLEAPHPSSMPKRVEVMKKRVGVRSCTWMEVADAWDKVIDKLSGQGGSVSTGAIIGAGWPSEEDRLGLDVTDAVMIAGHIGLTIPAPDGGQWLAVPGSGVIGRTFAAGRAEVIASLKRTPFGEKLLVDLEHELPVGPALSLGRRARVSRTAPRKRRLVPIRTLVAELAGAGILTVVKTTGGSLVQLVDKSK